MTKYLDSSGNLYASQRKYEEMRQYYCNVFSTLEGQKVIADIMQRGKFDTIIESDEDRIVHNFVKQILFMCGGHVTKIIGVHE